MKDHGGRLAVQRADAENDTAVAEPGDGHIFLQSLREIGDVLALKQYRVTLDPAPRLPILPCLDHEALLHEGIAPHLAVYVRDRGGDLHEAVWIPKELRIDIDVASTMSENTPESQARFIAALTERFPDHQVHVTAVSWLKGDHRVAHACRAQVTLRDVLLGPDLDRIGRAIERLQVISTLMEKESRVASWGARTIMTPFLALVGLLIVWSLGVNADAWWVVVTRYILTLTGVFFLYAGLKAVHLAEMANRVWKRSAEYGLILSERRRLAR
jgi:hypothetical protein